MKGFVDDIEAATTANRDFRKVLYTGRHLQLVLMSLAAGEEIGAETHATHDQFFRIEAGEGRIVIDGSARSVGDGDAIVVPAGARHNLINTGDRPLSLYTLYGPPNHVDGLVEVSKADAEASDERFDGVTTERSAEAPHPASAAHRSRA